MADEKGGGGGGSGWGAFEIIIVLLFAVAVISRLEGDPIKPLAVVKDKPSSTVSSSSGSPVVSGQTIDVNCGITVTSPYPLQGMGDAITVKGTISGCVFKSTDNKTLYMQVIEGNGSPLSETVVISPVAAANATFTFSQSIALSKQATTTTGYIIILPGSSATAEKNLNARIPVRLVIE